MAAPVRALPLPSPVAYPRMSSRGRSSCSRRHGPGVRAAAAAAAAEGASRATEPVQVVGVGSRKDAVIDFCLGSRTLSSTPIRFWYGTDIEFLTPTLHCLAVYAMRTSFLAFRPPWRAQCCSGDSWFVELEPHLANWSIAEVNLVYDFDFHRWNLTWNHQCVFLHDAAIFFGDM
jgi:hypothetical protein